MKVATEITNSIELKFSQVARAKIANGEKLVSLGLGEPYFKTPKEIIDATTQAIHDGYTRYLNGAGLPELRKRIQQKFSEENGFRPEIKDIIITVGAKQALTVILQTLLRPFDEVINITPCYLSFVQQIKIAEPDSIIHNIGLSERDLRLDIDKIRKSINSKTKVIIINSPHNPSGMVLSKKETEEIVQILMDYPNCYLISDELYEYLNFSDKPHISFASYPELNERVFTINSFSKTFSMTGWRIGYLSSPPKHSSLITNILFHSNMHVPTFIQKGVCVAFDIDRTFLKDYCTELKTTSKYIFDELDGTKLRMVMPESGFFCFVDITKTGLKSDEFAAGLVSKYNIALNPGIVFGEEWDNFVRISYSAEFETVKTGISGLKKFIGEIVQS